MPLRFRAIPEEARIIAEEGPHTFSLLEGVDGPTDALVGPDDLVSHPVYYLPLLAVATGSGLSSAMQVGWRDFSRSTFGHVVAEVDIVSDRVFRLVKRRGLTSSEADQFSRARLESIAVGEAEELEFRVLRFPPIVNFAIWLKGTTRDILIPLTSSSLELVVDRTYTAQEFFAAASESIRDLLEFLPERTNQ